MIQNVEIINNDYRRNRVIAFVKRRPGCSKQDVVRYCDEEGIGTRVTILNIIEELVIEGIISIYKEKVNSKAYRLTVNSENMLVIIPHHLQQLFQLFKTFVDEIKLLSQGNLRLEKHNKSIKSHMAPIEQDLIPTLPYEIIEIINRVYNFFFIFVLPQKVENSDVITELYSIYYTTLNKFYSYITKELSDIIPRYTLEYISKSPMYRSYISPDSTSGLFKINRIALICRSLNVDDKLYDVLDFLWSSNKEFIHLVYEIEEDRKFFDTYLRDLNKMFEDYKYDDDVLKKIHISIDYYIRGALNPKVKLGRLNKYANFINQKP